jgi:prophage regulatory protein
MSDPTHSQAPARATWRPPVPQPTPRLLRLPEVIHKVGLSRTTIYELIAAGEFPRQINIGPRSVAWCQDDLDAWIASKRQGPRSAD